MIYHLPPHPPKNYYKVAQADTSGHGVQVLGHPPKWKVFVSGTLQCIHILLPIFMNLIPFPPPGLMLSMATTVFLVLCPGLWESQSLLSPLPYASDILSFQPTSEVVLISCISLLVSQVVFRCLPFLDDGSTSVAYLGVSKCFFYLSLKQNSKNKKI